MSDPTSLFISHGAPSVAIEESDFTNTLREYGATLSPRAVVIASAHYVVGEAAPVVVNANARPQLIYDFSGFSPELYSVRYDAAGEPGVAATVAEMLNSAGIEAKLDEARGWDHGVWVPLKRLFPEAAIPIVEISVPVDRGAEKMFHIGRALHALKDEGILFIGSGGIVHNLRLLREGADAPVEPWAQEFDEWVNRAVREQDFTSLVQHRLRSKYSTLAAPTTDHYDPLPFAVGAAGNYSEVLDVYRGFTFGTLSMQTIALR